MVVSVVDEDGEMPARPAVSKPFLKPPRPPMEVGLALCSVLTRGLVVGCSELCTSSRLVVLSKVLLDVGILPVVKCIAMWCDGISLLVVFC